MERLEKRALVCDGAMGTMLYAKGVSLNRCFDELNLTTPHLVKEVHVGYVKAGAEVIETNTFGANRFRLQKFNLADKVHQINLAGAQLAREVAGEDLYVAGSVGPLGLRLEPLGSTSLEEGRNIFREQISALIEGGVDLIVIETMIDLNEAHQALLAARNVGSFPLVVQMTIQDDGITPTGAAPEDFTRQLDLWGADIIGLNCSVGPAAVQDALERMASVTSKKLSAQPNAGLPRTVQGRSIYLCSPEYMAAYASRFIETGVRLIGGCCGTTPEHVKAIKAAVRSITLKPKRVTAATPRRAVQPIEPLPVEKRSRLGEKLARNTFPVLVEVVPPKGCDPTREVEGAQYLCDHGVDAVNIPDSAGTTARMSGLTLAAILQREAELEVVLHYSSRDRNVLTVQADWLGASALGLRNIVALTWDTNQYSTNLETPTFDVDAIGLVNIANNLNRGLDVGGNPLSTQTGFLIGVRVNPYALNLEEELQRFRSKIEAGANFALTQPVFDVEKLAQFLDRVEATGIARIPIIASIWPLTSYRNAEFANNELPGVSVPSSVMERMRKADTGDRARAEGLKIAQEILTQIGDMVQGVQISAPFGRYAMAVEVAQVRPQRVEIQEPAKNLMVDRPSPQAG